MSNKFKEIFSNNMCDFGGTLHFENKEAYENFRNALQIVQDEGKEVDLDGISTFTADIKDGQTKYPILIMRDLRQFTISPSKENISFELDTDYGSKSISFNRFKTKNEVVFETSENEITYFKIVFQMDESKVILSYRLQPHYAKSVKDIVDSCNITIAFLNKMFIPDDNLKVPDDDIILIKNIKSSILEFESFFNKLYLIEQKLKFSFITSKIIETDNIYTEVNELYFLVVENKIIRLNARLNETETNINSIKPGLNELKAGMPINLTFLSRSDFIIFGKSFTIHTANLLSNAIVKAIEKSEDGKARILYGDIDEKPMYISYSGFRTVNEAKQEMKILMDHKNNYIEALTLQELIKNNAKYV